MNEILPAPMITDDLDELFDAGDTSEKAYRVFAGRNLGHRVFLLQVPMHEFKGISEVANSDANGEPVAQRKLDLPHAQKLAVYILKGLLTGAIANREATGKEPLPALVELLEGLGKQPYLSLQPLVANIRDTGTSGKGLRAERILSKADNTTAAFNVFLSQRHVLWVIDGQHRRHAMSLVFDFLDEVTTKRAYPKKGPHALWNATSPEVTNEQFAAWQDAYTSARSFCTVSVELHLGLNIEQERQLFHDLNNLGKKVDKNLALKFDHSNPVNLFIKDELHENLDLKIVDQEVKDWKADPGSITLKDAVAVNAILFLNKTNIGGATPAVVNERSTLAKAFWEAVIAIPSFGEEGAKERTVAAQPVVLKALAKLAFDLGFSNRRPKDSAELLDRFLSSIADIDFSHDNPMWRYYELNPAQRANFGLEGLESYLPSAEGGNRDIGSFQGTVMRFGAKHNDIFPIIGDMVRWRLGLPSRRTE